MNIGSEDFFVPCEVVIYVLFWLRYSNTERWNLFRWSYVSGLLTAPLTGIWAQDEIFAVIPLLFFPVTNQSNFGRQLFVIVIGYYVGKMFYVFLALAGLFTQMRLQHKIVLLVVILVLAFSFRADNFTPPNWFGANFWIFSSLSLETQKALSFLLYNLIFLTIQIRYFRSADFITPIQQFIIYFSIFQLLFYHANWAYFVFLTLPLCQEFLRSSISARTLCFAIAWFAVTVSQRIVDILLMQRMLPGLPLSYLQILLVLLTFALGFLSIKGFVQAWLDAPVQSASERVSSRRSPS